MTNTPNHKKPTDEKEGNAAVSESSTLPTETTPPPVPPKASPTTSKTPLIIAASVVGTLIVIGLGLLGWYVTTTYLRPNAQPSLTTTNDGNTTITAEESSIAAVAEKVGPSVVSIITETRSSSYFGPTTGEAAGTGIILSKDGYVMTNNHVLESATKVSVVDSAGELYEDVTIIGRDPLNDVAFLKISAATEFTPATLGSSSTIRTGQQVVAIGNALGQYSNTVTSGIISGTGRPITASTSEGDAESLTDLIQTDASINPGNSGGPLVNMAGQVIGINTAIVEDANGIGFAIPINATKGMIAGVLETGKISRSYLGVNFLTVTPDVAREYDLPVKSGAYIYAGDSTSPVVRNSPADQAGLRAKDIITKINDETVGTQGSLSSILGEYRPGDKVTVTYLRDGKTLSTSVVLGEYKE